MNYILDVDLEIRTRAGHHIHFAVDVRDSWLVHWHSPVNAFRSSYGVERTEGSSYRLLLLLNKNRWS